MTKPEIEGCACGQDHEFMPVDYEYDQWLDKWFEIELVCRIHKRHIPCRKCMYG